MKTPISNTMKAPLKSTLTALSLAILAAVAISGCTGSGGPANYSHESDIRGTGHVPGGHRDAKPSATGAHQGTDIRK